MMQTKVAVNYSHILLEVYNLQRRGIHVLDGFQEEVYTYWMASKKRYTRIGWLPRRAIHVLDGYIDLHVVQSPACA
jgi:hypothetical protein